MKTNEKLVTLENVSKKYSGKAIIDSVSHTFYKGESIVFYGHNGCGKSTMLKLISGLISISGGKLQYHEKLRFSYVPEKFVGMEIEMIDYLRGVARMEGVPPTVIDTLISDFFLESMIHTRMDKLSKGSLQKVGVIQALMAPHEVILLDEPLSGQDAESQKVFIDKMNELREHGITIFMACHEKKLIDALSDKVYTIEHGNLVEIDASDKAAYSIYVKKNPSLTMRSDMRSNGDRYELTAEEAALKATVLGLYEDGWEIIGIEKLD
ncbi:ATP-binding cassette domain-containing protein [Butyrivibrio sp. WCE2006]|uniref:ATP-binding cassette domain-containing protein n=1 Tax=Butyrivibrio sp. WCE2006 TaxID=1410611 RepID=UPI0006791AD2|nr:ATP-binding cassette domain-containing protein [Butyrivibrio sp. WCE2006]